MKPNVKKLLFVTRQPPYGNSLPREALDAVLAASAYEQDISYLFINDGVFQLCSSQGTATIGQKNLSATLQVLELYGVENIYACDDSLKVRGISLDSLCIDADILDGSAVKQLLKSQHQILSF